MRHFCFGNILQTPTRNEDQVSRKIENNLKVTRTAYPFNWIRRGIFFHEVSPKFQNLFSSTTNKLAYIKMYSLGSKY